MKNVKIDEKSKFLSAVFLVIVLIGVAFFLGYRKFEDKATIYNNDNANLEARIDELKMYYETEEQNLADTEKMTNEIKDIFSNYVADARFEDGIYEAFNLYGGSSNTLSLERIVFSERTVIRDIPQEVVSAAQIEDYNNQITFYSFDVNYDGVVSYDGLKSMVREISSGEYNLSIAKMRYEINESAYINGTTGLSFYYITGAGLDYQEPPVSAYETGLESLFGIGGANIGTEEETADTEG